MRVEFAGMPGFAVPPYARAAGTVKRRSPPTDMPATPMSQPLMTSPEPSLKVNGLPFLFAVNRELVKRRALTHRMLTVEDFAVLQFTDVAHADLVTLLRRRAFAGFLVVYFDALDDLLA